MKISGKLQFIPDKCKWQLEVVDSILFRLWQLRYFENVEVEE